MHQLKWVIWKWVQLIKCKNKHMIAILELYSTKHKSRIGQLIAFKTIIKMGQSMCDENSWLAMRYKKGQQCTLFESCPGVNQNRISKIHLLDCGHSKTMDFTASIHLVCLWKLLIVRSMNEKWLAAHRMLVHIIRQEKKRWATFVRTEFRRSRFNDWIHPELFSWVFRTLCSSHGPLQTHWILNAFSNYNNYTFNRNDSFVVYICSGCGSLDGGIHVASIVHKTLASSILSVYYTVAFKIGFHHFSSEIYTRNPYDGIVETRMDCFLITIIVSNFANWFKSILNT